jgi:hypothetical protein
MATLGLVPIEDRGEYPDDGIRSVDEHKDEEDDSNSFRGWFSRRMRKCCANVSVWSVWGCLDRWIDVVSIGGLSVF